MKVDFIGIGVQKAATSWVHDMLAAHPEIETSEPKELDYFTDHFNRGHYWYESHFSDHGAALVRGECSPSYFTSLSAPARAHAYNSGMRLLCILRDPVERAFSNHLHEIRKGHIPDTLSFEEAMERNACYVDQGRYKAHLGRWIGLFGREAVLVLLVEDIAREPDAAFAQVCRHLGVDATFRPEGLGERRHESIAVRAADIQRILRGAGNMARRAGLGQAVARIKQAPGIRQVLEMNRRDLRSDIPPMHERTARDLAALYAEDIRFVTELLDRPALPWPSAAQPEGGGELRSAAPGGS